MSWVKLDDAIAEHRKVVALEDYEAPCCWLNVKAIAWSNRQLADGLVPKAVVRRLASTFLGRLRMGQQVLMADDLMARLISVGLWIDEGDSIRVHDYLQYQPSRAAIEEKRAKDAERKRDGRHETSTRTPRGVHADKSRSPVGQTMESAPPDPARPVPSQEKRGEDAPRGSHRVPDGLPLEDATERIYRLRGCLNPNTCHLAFIEKQRAAGRHLADWHAEERRLAQFHNERDVCRLPAVRAVRERMTPEKSRAERAAALAGGKA